MRARARPREGGAAGVATCKGCGCTDLAACPGGCWWISVNYATGEGICSSCVAKGRARRRRR
jgi:hypothetical protein